MRIAIIVVALLIAGGTAFGVKMYLDQTKTDALTEVEQLKAEYEAKLAEARGAGAESFKVLVAARDLQIGAKIIPEDLIWVDWPVSEDATLPAQYISRDPTLFDEMSLQQESSQYLERTVRAPLSAGEPVLESKLFDGEGILKYMLGNGMTAVTIPLDVQSGVAGLIAPGDRVDIMLTHNLSADAQFIQEPLASRAAEIVLRDIRILALDNFFSIPADQPAFRATTATLEVTPEQHAKVSLAKQMGTLTLVPRSVAQSVEDESGAEADAIGLTAATPSKVSQMLCGAAACDFRILVAARDLGEGSLLRPEDMTWAVLDRPPPVGAILEKKDALLAMKGALLTAPVAKGQFLRKDMVVQPNDPSFVPRIMTPGMRAMSLPLQGIDPRVVGPGDSVDLILTTQWREVGSGDSEDGNRGSGGRLFQRKYSETIASNVRLLKIEGMPMLEVTPKQVEALSMAATLGQLTVSLRPRGEAPDSTRASLAVYGPYTADDEVSTVVAAIMDGADLYSPGHGFGAPSAPVAASVSPSTGAKTIKIWRAQNAEFVEPGL